MDYKKKLKKVGEYEYEIPKEEKMLVPCKIFVSSRNLNSVDEGSLRQLANVACLPGILNSSIGMSDIHVGYGFPIGGVAAFDLKRGVVSPGGVGYDINCSVRLLKTNLSVKDVEKNKEKIAEVLFNEIPSGVGKKGRLILKEKQVDEVLKRGAQWVVEQGFGKKEDYENIEEQGCMQQANPENVSKKARSRGIPQLGSLGAGNHFLEVQSVEEIFNEKTAKVFGLEKGRAVIMIHCGSRGLGHQVASDYMLEMEKQYGIKNLPDKELICAPIESDLGKKYYSAMCAAANFGFANKQILTHWIRESMKQVFPEFQADVVYEVCHNIAKIEEHEINGKKQKVLVTRKGATRSLGKGHKDIPEKYRKVGQPVLLPGSMGTASYVLVGTKKAEKISFASTAHGAGRVKSRLAAKNEFSLEKIKKSLSDKGILVVSGSEKGILEEAPEVYKDVDEIARISHEAGIGSLVAKLKPMIVIKG